MESLDGIDELHMAGTRATFTVRKGERVDRGEIAEAFAERGMKLESLDTARRPRAKAVYRIGAGVG